MNSSQRENNYAIDRGQQKNESLQDFIQQTTDPQKPFKIIQKNFDDYKKNFEQQTQLTANEIKQRFQNAKPAENDAKNFDSYCCEICKLLAYEPVICSKCEKAVMCQSCKDECKVKKRGSFECPNCKSLNQIRNLGRKENEARDNIFVVCSTCSQDNNQMRLSKYVSHQCPNFFKPRQCPQNCGVKIISSSEIQEHYQECQNSIVNCLCCSSSIKKSQINHQIDPQINLQINEQKNLQQKQQRKIQSPYNQLSNKAFRKTKIEFDDIQMSESRQLFSNQKINYEPVQNEENQQQNVNKKIKEQFDQIELLKKTNKELDDEQNKY